MARTANAVGETHGFGLHDGKLDWLPRPRSNTALLRDLATIAGAALAAIECPRTVIR